MSTPTARRPATRCEAFQRTAAAHPDAVALRTGGMPIAGGYADRIDAMYAS